MDVNMHPRHPSDGSKVTGTKPEFMVFLFQTEMAPLVERGGEKMCGLVL